MSLAAGEDAVERARGDADEAFEEPVGGGGDGHATGAHAEREELRAEEPWDGVPAAMRLLDIELEGREGKTYVAQKKRYMHMPMKTLWAPPRYTTISGQWST